jgi:hypothetical protein
MKFRMHRDGYAESMMSACEIEPTMALEQMSKMNSFAVNKNWLSE